MQNLKEKYSDMLIGFEEFGFTEQQIKAALPDFEQAERDYKCCLYCKVGRAEKESCKTSVGNLSYNGYFALSSKGCKMYRRLSFAVHNCPGPVERRELIAMIKTAKGEGVLFAGGKG